MRNSVKGHKKLKLVGKQLKGSLVILNRLMVL